MGTWRKETEKRRRRGVAAHVTPFLLNPHLPEIKNRKARKRKRQNESHYKVRVVGEGCRP